MRDRAIQTYAGTHLARMPGTTVSPPVLLLLGPRGSGKTSLLRHLETWGQAAPLAFFDLAKEQGDRTLIDVVAELVFQLQARKEGFRPLRFPSVMLMLLAAAAEVNTRDRQAAVAQMKLLAEQDTAQKGYSYEGVQSLLQRAAAVMGGLLPGWVTQIIPLLRVSDRAVARLRIWNGVSRAAGDPGGPRAGADFLVSVNHLFHGDRENREKAERLLFDAFLKDLRASYERRRGHARRTAYCLVLLDNADTGLGEWFLRLLVDARGGVDGRAGLADPLFVVSTARRRPETLIEEEQRRLADPPDYARSWAAGPERFHPVPVGQLHVGQLRDLDRGEVETHAQAVLAALPDGAARPATHNASYWLGWIVHTMTRGQPAVTGAVLDAMARHPGRTPWQERLQLWASHTVSAGSSEVSSDVSTEVRESPAVTTLLDLLLADAGDDLRGALPRAAAAVTHGQAEQAARLWGGVARAGKAAFDVDGQRAYHPALRFLLLRRLDALGDGDGDGGAPGEVRDAVPGEADRGSRDATGGGPAAPPGSWEHAHRALAARAAADGDRRLAAYHDLARGDVDAAVDYLHGLFHQVPAQQWWEALAFVQRAPARWPQGRPEPARARYNRLAGTPAGDRARRVITRLLVAGWITVHPDTGRSVDVYEDPLGDPYAELYGDLFAEFLTLRDLTRRGERDRQFFRDKADAYGRKPW